MALLGEIRNRFGWLMMGLIGIGLVGFLFMDISPGNNAGGRAGVDIGTVNGETISQAQMQAYTDELSGRPGMISEEVREIAWNQLVREALLNQETGKMGLDVTAKEMGELFLGPDNVMSPVVRNQFMNRQTGQVDRNQLKGQIDAFNGNTANLQPEQVEQIKKAAPAWKQLEKRVKFERLSTKYTNLIQKGLYTPAWMAEAEYSRQNTNYSFSYVRIPYTNIPNDKVTVSDDELTAYIKSMGKKFEQEPSASIEYVSFDVVPTQGDLDKYQAEMKTLATEFQNQATSEDDSMFIFQNDGFIDDIYYTKSELTDPQEVRDTLLSAEKGFVYGPYASENHYKVIKVLDSHLVPDSVRASHILRRVQTQEDLQREYALLDSLKKAIAKGETSFDSAAVKYSVDGSREKAGDLGYAAKGQYVPEFERYVFHTGEKDSLGIIQSQFGLHLIKVTGYQYTTDSRGVKIAYITTPIIPSEETIKAIHGKVNEFMANSPSLEKLRSNAEAQNLSVSTASGLALNGYDIVGLGKTSTSADIIKWAHSETTETGAIANLPYIYSDEELNYTKQFVVPALVSKSEKGLATINDPAVRAEADRAVRNKKKAELVKKELGEAASLADVNTKYGVPTEVATNVAYASSFITNVGLEPKVVAVASKLETGKVSSAIQGNEGVYVISVLSKNTPPAPADYNRAKQEIAQRAGQVVASGLFEALRNTSTIEDNRSTFY
ncbi:MAG: hypothetical protein GY810_13650 [Aureispira sp.]|nr:hypothetical protein [Aureispira sp.]